jgi:hypothetical protein
LSTLGIIQSEDVLDEMSSVRSTYKRAFRELVVTALRDIKTQGRLETRRLTSPDYTTDEDTDGQEEADAVDRMASNVSEKRRYDFGCLMGTKIA